MRISPCKSRAFLAASAKSACFSSQAISVLCVTPKLRANAAKVGNSEAVSSRVMEPSFFCTSVTLKGGTSKNASSRAQNSGRYSGTVLALRRVLAGVLRVLTRFAETLSAPEEIAETETPSPGAGTGPQTASSAEGAERCLVVKRSSQKYKRRTATVRRLTVKGKENKDKKIQTEGCLYLFILANFINFVKFKTERRRSSQLYIRQNKSIFLQLILWNRA